MTSYLSNDSSLPSWINFNGTHYNISTTTYESVTVLLNATDDGNLTTSQTFIVKITNNAPAATVTLSDESVYENQSYTKNFDISTIFNDADGHVMTYSYQD